MNEEDKKDREREREEKKSFQSKSLLAEQTLLDSQKRTTIHDGYMREMKFQSRTPFSILCVSVQPMETVKG